MNDIAPVETVCHAPSPDAKFRRTTIVEHHSTRRTSCPISRPCCNISNFLTWCWLYEHRWCPLEQPSPAILRHHHEAFPFSPRSIRGYYHLEVGAIRVRSHRDIRAIQLRFHPIYRPFGHVSASCHPRSRRTLVHLGPARPAISTPSILSRPHVFPSHGAKNLHFVPWLAETKR